MDQSGRLFHSRTCEQLEVRFFADALAMGRQAAEEAARILGEAVASRGTARAIIATGASQNHLLANLRTMPGIPWEKITVFHMDEYLGLPETHPASFRKYLRDFLTDTVKPGKVELLEGDASEPIDACRQYAALLQEETVDLCCLGIGENGHIAFNDPPVADFEDDDWVKIVQLDEACRRQQVGEGHYPTLEVVPRYALTLTIPALRSARHMLCVVPEKRKAEAVRLTLEGPLATSCPASILRRTPHCILYLDTDSASLLQPQG